MARSRRLPWGHFHRPVKYGARFRTHARLNCIIISSILSCFSCGFSASAIRSYELKNCNAWEEAGLTVEWGAVTRARDCPLPS
jgi:hypothetical protein